MKHDPRSRAASISVLHPIAEKQVLALQVPSAKEIPSSVAIVDSGEKSERTTPLCNRTIATDEERMAREAILAEEGLDLRESELLEAVTAILWHVVCTPAHVEALHALEAVPVLVALLDHPTEQVICGGCQIIIKCS